MITFEKVSVSTKDVAKTLSLFNMTVWVDITAPLYWWQQFDAYKICAIANSYSIYDKINERPFELDDFSHENLIDGFDDLSACYVTDDQLIFSPLQTLQDTIHVLNNNRDSFLKSNCKKYEQQILQLLPMSYNQCRVVKINYSDLHSIYRQIRGFSYKFDEWNTFWEWVEHLPYHEFITGGKHK